MRMEVIEVSKVIRKHTVLDRVAALCAQGKFMEYRALTDQGRQC